MSHAPEEYKRIDSSFNFDNNITLLSLKHFIHIYKMDPGYKLLQHIKTVPNLINEDPSIVTPKNSSFLDMPWDDLSKLLASRQQESSTHKRRTSNASVETASTSSEADLGNWDSTTGFQDALHSRQ